MNEIRDAKVDSNCVLKFDIVDGRLVWIFSVLRECVVIHFSASLDVIPRGLSSGRLGVA